MVRFMFLSWMVFLAINRLLFYQVRIHFIGLEFASILNMSTYYYSIFLNVSCIAFSEVCWASFYQNKAYTRKIRTNMEKIGPKQIYSKLIDRWNWVKTKQMGKMGKKTILIGWCNRHNTKKVSIQKKRKKCDWLLLIAVWSETLLFDAKFKSLSKTKHWLFCNKWRNLYQ